MGKKEIITIDEGLNPKDKKDKILIRLRGYYFYYNEPNESTHDILIHKHNCGFCCYGAGTSRLTEPGRNGAWVGPFTTPEQAETFATRHFPYRRGDIRRCSCVLHKKGKSSDKYFKLKKL